MRTKYLFLNSRDEFFRVDISKIVYFEGDGNYTSFVLCNNERGTLCMNLAQTQKILVENLREQASIFARVGKKYIVNLTYVFHIALLKQTLTLTDGERFTYRLPVSKEALKKLKELYLALASWERVHRDAPKYEDV